MTTQQVFQSPVAVESVVKSSIQFHSLNIVSSYPVPGLLQIAGGSHFYPIVYPILNVSDTVIITI